MDIEQDSSCVRRLSPCLPCGSPPIAARAAGCSQVRAAHGHRNFPASMDAAVAHLRLDRTSAANKVRTLRWSQVASATSVSHHPVGYRLFNYASIRGLLLWIAGAAAAAIAACGSFAAQIG